MKEDMKGLYAAILLSMVVIFATNWLFPKNPARQEVSDTPAKIEVTTEVAQNPLTETAPNTEAILKADKRISIVNDAVRGSIRIKGARLDELYLNKYNQTMDIDSPNVELLTPAQSKAPYYAEFGFIDAENKLRLPNSETLWQIKGGKLTPQTPVVLEWDNGQGIKFIRKISIDNNYMFKIYQSVENNSKQKISLYPYGLINKTHIEGEKSTSVVHEGMNGVLDTTLKEIKYSSLKDGKKEEFKSNGGWAGFSDHYWFSALILNNNQKANVKFSNIGNNMYQVDFVDAPLIVEAGSVGTIEHLFFAGAKEITLIDKYSKDLHIDKFDLAVDFGWYYFLTKPFFYILNFLYKIIGNMGWAILLFAALLRLAMFPVANKSYESMSKMKKVQPKIQSLQEKYKDDKMKLQQEMMELYRKEKINPASGCLPMLIQIPVFFSLYKVLNIAIEIRHAPFIGWIKDLSAPDPLTISVLTHIPLPSFLDIGIWPIIMGLTMYVQQKLNPKPSNPDQARMFALMPVIFMFMLGHFASGLVIYWTLSNILSIIQQKVIMKKIGVD
ncbi:MAG: membrane protein insertase YidC [Alphaproteobacteria bacterium]|nr:membrane protein insertase YidC [Alphaproteobacteria bacterium]MBQ7285927.1 membrane protein insertase YidC [Alphaproteobacteria bacterium]